MPTINPDSSIPKLIKFIRHSFRECEFDEVQNILVKREMSMKLEMENLVKERDSLTKKLDSLEKVQSFTLLEKCDAEEKLDGMRRRCEELEKIIVQKEEEVEKLESQKSDYVENLVCSNSKCEEMDERLFKLGKELEKLRRQNLNAYETIEEMKAKEIEADLVLLKERDSLMKKLDSLESVQSFTMMEKCDVEKKLERMRRRCEESDKMVVQKEEKIEKLEIEKLDYVEKLVCSNSKCEKMDERLIKLENELEELRRHNLNANETIEEMKAKEIEADRIVQELKHKHVEAVQTIDELRAKTMESDKTAEVVNQLNRRISLSQSILANMLSVNVEDLASLVDERNDYDAEDTVMLPEVPPGSDVRDLPHSGAKEVDADRACTNPSPEPASSNSAVAENNATFQYNEGEEPVVRGSRTSVMQSGGEVARAKKTVPDVVIVISDSDNDNENVPSGRAKKRDRRQGGDDSSHSCSRKRKISSSCTQPSVLVPCSSIVEASGCDGISDADAVDLVESEDDESCSDTYLTNLVENIKSKGQCK